jgi:hypothetical protein
VVSGVALSIRVTRYFKLLVIYRNPLREMVNAFSSPVTLSLNKGSRRATSTRKAKTQRWGWVMRCGTG